MLPFTLHPVGDSALLAVFEQRIAPEIGTAVAALNARVQAAAIPGVGETVPAFASLMITYDPLVTDYDTVAAALQKLADMGYRTVQMQWWNPEFEPELVAAAVRDAGLTCVSTQDLYTAIRDDFEPCMPGGITASTCWAFCPASRTWAGWMNVCSPRACLRRAQPSRPGQWASAASRRVFIPSPARAVGSSSAARR